MIESSPHLAIKFAVCNFPCELHRLWRQRMSGNVYFQGMKAAKFLRITVFISVLAGLTNCSDHEDPSEDPVNDKTDVNVEDIQIFPSTHLINKDISGSPVDPNSDIILDNIGRDIGLHADFGSGTWEGAPIGIPYVVVGPNQPKVPVTYRGNSYDDNYGDESDPGPMPIPLDAPVEGSGEGDSHVIAVDDENGMLYELYNASRINDGWAASSGAIFDFSKVEYRPLGRTSADAAGLPIFPLLVRYDEVEKGEMDHACRAESFSFQPSRRLDTSE